jgi:hypothetical protein
LTNVAICQQLLRLGRFSTINIDIIIDDLLINKKIFGNNGIDP